MKIERQLQGILNTLFTEIIKQRGLEDKISPYPLIEEGRADILLKTPQGKNIFFIELKDPTTKDGKTIYDFNLMQREARRAEKLEVAYFGICNFTTATLLYRFDFFNNSDFKGSIFTLTEFKNMQKDLNAFIQQKTYRQKLESIAHFYVDKALELLQDKKIKSKAMDEIFIFVLQDLISAYIADIALEALRKYETQSVFKKQIQSYAIKQQWAVPTTYEEIENITFIALLVLVSKLIFYKTYYDNKTWTDLAPLHIPDTLTKADEVKEKIWAFFEEFKSITNDFELLIGEKDDIIFQLPFVSDSIVEVIQKVISSSKLYDFSQIEYDIIGRIFENLIRQEERHKLGQYFTPPDVIDFMLAFVIKRGDEKIFDPSCGSGTFLVRAYQRKKEISRKMHTILLEEIYGNDIANYPAYLAMLNLAIRDVKRPSYPKILHKDFFSIVETKTEKVHNAQGKIENKLLPKFDAIIGNPPYTRQEDIGSMQGTVGKDIIQQLVKDKWLFTPSARTSIYAYFFYHSASFLKEGGMLAFVVSNSWLDTDFGTDLQAFLCKQFEIIAVIDSQIERFFPAASVNTSIVIARKQKVNGKPRANQVRFVYLQKTIADLLKQYKSEDGLAKSILDFSASKPLEGMKIRLIDQIELEKHTKWGQFLKAPQIYFDILEKGKGKFIPLKEIAEVKFGIKTGSNEFFIVKDVTNNLKEEEFKFALNNSKAYQSAVALHKHKLVAVLNGFNELWFIEQAFMYPLLSSPKDIDKYEIDLQNVPYNILIISDDKKTLQNKFPYVYAYIEAGEIKNIHERPTCQSRVLWYNVGLKELPTMSFNYMINDFGKTFLGKVFTNNNFHNIYPKRNEKSIWLYLNSTWAWLVQQIIIRSNMGDGVGKIETYEFANFPMIDIDLEKLDIDLGNTRNFKEELGTAKNLKTINPERLKLDHEILKAIGYTQKTEREKILLELYQETVSLIEQRLSKAQSQKSAQKTQKENKQTALLEQLKQKLADKGVQVIHNAIFAKQLIQVASEISAVKNTQKKLIDEYWLEQFQEAFDLAVIMLREQGKLFGS